MFGSSRNAARAYSQVGLETGVTAASPHQLIKMLFDGASLAIVKARQHMLEGDVIAKGQAISKAIQIIESGLRTGLNFEAGGELAQNLNGLYSYMTQQLLQANLNNQAELLDEVYQLISDIKLAWEAIDPQAQAVPQEAATLSSASARITGV